MRKISLRITICYYPSWKHSHNALAYYTPLEMFDVFSQFELAEMSVAPTISIPLVPAKNNAPRSAPDTPTTREIIFWSVIYTWCVIFKLLDLVYLSSVGYSILSSPLLLPLRPKLSLVPSFQKYYIFHLLPPLSQCLSSRRNISRQYKRNNGSTIRSKVSSPTFVFTASNSLGCVSYTGQKAL
jgi:hypothetical protein